MKKKLIEMVCSGNVGRSPVAELIANNYLRSVGASKDYLAISSGINVDKIKSGEFSIDELKLFVKNGKQMGYNNLSLSNLDYCLENDYSQKKIDLYAKEFMDFLVEDESEMRDKILNGLGVKGIAKETIDQTVARKDVFAVLPMDKKNYSKVLNIYNDSKYNPLISVMSVLATGKLGEEVAGIPEPSEDFRDVYKEKVEKIIEETPKAIKKIIGA